MLVIASLMRQLTIGPGSNNVRRGEVETCFEVVKERPFFCHATQLYLSKEVPPHWIQMPPPRALP